MAEPRTPRTADRGARRPSSWRVTVALLCGFAIAIAGLHTVLAGAGWFFALTGTVAVVLGAALAARAVSTRRWMPTLASAFALWVILSQFFAGGELWLRLLPLGATWERFGLLVEQGTRSITVQVVPADADDGMLFLLTLGIGSLALVADALAATLRLPALAGLPLVAVLAIPATVGPDRTDGLIFALACVAYLALLRAHAPRRDNAFALGVGAVTVIAALLTPLFLPPIKPAPDSSDRITGVLSGVNPVLDLGQNLRRTVERDILSYTARTGDGQYLRLVSLHTFTGDTWAPDEFELDENNKPFSVAAPPGMDADVRTESDTVWVQVDNLGSPWLPTPYPVGSISGLIGDWFWHAEDLTFTSPTSTARGQDYRVVSTIVQPTPAQLTSAGPPPASMARYLELPDDLPAVIAETALSVTEAASSDYGRAVALQDFFRNGTFTYSESAPVDNDYDGTGMEMIADFLDAQAGYCVHFASAMAVMARVLGIPSRVAVGTLPGALSDELREGRRVMNVTTGDLHAWPELYFDGVGWVRFEPTTSRGFVPEYADRETPGVPTLPLPTDPRPSASPTPTTAPLPTLAPETPGEGSTDASGLATVLLAVTIGLGVLLVLLLPAIVRALVRRRRLSRLDAGAPLALTGWRELIDTADDLGMAVPDTATPREAAAALGSSHELARVVAQLEREAFSPSRAASRNVTDVQMVLRQLRSRARWHDRLRAVLAPRSLATRLRSRLTG